MAGLPIRVDEKTRERLRALSKSTGRTMTEILSDAVEAYRRHLILAKTNAAFARINSSPAEKASLDKERKLWDRTLRDGLDEE